MRRPAFVDACLAAFLIISWFVSGSGYLQGLVNYPTWLDLGPMIDNADFLRLRQAHYWLAYPLIVIPGMVGLTLNAMLVYLRPEGISWGLLVAILLISIGIAVSTFVVQVPLQDQIDVRGYDREVIARLIESDFWMRKLPGVLLNVLLIVVTWQAVRRRAS